MEAVYTSKRRTSLPFVVLVPLYLLLTLFLVKKSDFGSHPCPIRLCLYRPFYVPFRPCIVRMCCQLNHQRKTFKLRCLSFFLFLSLSLNGVTNGLVLRNCAHCTYTYFLYEIPYVSSLLFKEIFSSLVIFY